VEQFDIDGTVLLLAIGLLLHYTAFSLLIYTLNLEEPSRR